MKFHRLDQFFFPCGCAPSEVVFLDEDGTELDDVTEIELTGHSVRITKRFTLNGIPTTKDRFGEFKVVCKHSRPYSNGFTNGLEG